MAKHIQMRRDTAANWEHHNPVLMQGEMGIVTDDPNLYKVGDGTTAWNSLPYRGYNGTIAQGPGESENAVMSQKATTHLVSVSQNTDTGHTEINIGGDVFPIPSLNDIYGELQIVWVLNKVINGNSGNVTPADGWVITEPFEINRDIALIGTYDIYQYVVYDVSRARIGSSSYPLATKELLYSDIITAYPNAKYIALNIYSGSVTPLTTEDIDGWYIIENNDSIQEQINKTKSDVAELDEKVTDLNKEVFGFLGDATLDLSTIPSANFAKIGENNLRVEQDKTYRLKAIITGVSGVMILYPNKDNTSLYYIFQNNDIKDITFPIDNNGLWVYVQSNQAGQNGSFEIQMEQVSLPVKILDIETEIDVINGNDITMLETVSNVQSAHDFTISDVPQKKGDIYKITVAINPSNVTGLMFYYENSWQGQYKELRNGDSFIYSPQSDLNSLMFYANYAINEVSITLQNIGKIGEIEENINNLSTESETNREDIAKINDRFTITSIAMFSNIAVCGDSYVAGGHWVGSTPHEDVDISWGKVLGRQFGIDVAVFASSGADTNTFQSREACLPALLAADAKQLYIFALGINDATYVTLGSITDIHDEDYTLNPNTFYGNYGRIIEQTKAKSPNGKIVLCKVCAPNLPGAAYDWSSAAIEEIANHYGIPYLETKDSVYLTNDWYTAHIITGHPSAVGYSSLALAIAELMEKSMQNDISYYEDYVPF